MILIQHLSKRFGKLPVLDGLSLDLQAPGVHAILGPNGSGKTTLLKCILGMVLPDRGEIRMAGKTIARTWAYRDQIGYLPQIARFPENLKVRELLQMIRDFRAREAHDDALIERFDLGAYLDKRLGTLSGGTRQKVNIVQAFLFDCPVIMLDEPSAGLDPLAMIRLKELIREEKARGKTLLITTHIMPFVEEMADEIVFLLDGRVHFQGPVDTLKEVYEEDNVELAIARMLEQQARREKPLPPPPPPLRIQATALRMLSFM